MPGVLLLYHSPENAWPLPSVCVRARFSERKHYRIPDCSARGGPGFFWLLPDALHIRLSVLETDALTKLCHAPIYATRCCVIIYQLIAYMIAVCAAV